MIHAKPRTFVWHGAQSDAARKLAHDIDGRPLTARHVVGRQEEGAGDVALPREAYDEIATAGTGGPILETAEGLKRRDVGATDVNRWTRLPRSVQVDPRLSDTQFDRVAAHEIGHVIDQVAGEIPVVGLNTELRQLYNTLQSGTERTRNPVEPKTGLQSPTTSARVHGASHSRHARHGVTRSRVPLGDPAPLRPARK